jgi:hypothetical protein
LEKLDGARRGIDWIGLAQNRNKWRALVDAVMNLQVPQDSQKFYNGCTTGCLYSDAQIHRVIQLPVSTLRHVVVYTVIT